MRTVKGILLILTAATMAYVGETFLLDTFWVQGITILLSLLCFIVGVEILFDDEE